MGNFRSNPQTKIIPPVPSIPPPISSIPIKIEPLARDVVHRQHQILTKNQQIAFERSTEFSPASTYLPLLKQQIKLRYSQLTDSIFYKTLASAIAKFHCANAGLREGYLHQQINAVIGNNYNNMFLTHYPLTPFHTNAPFKNRTQIVRYIQEQIHAVLIYYNAHVFDPAILLQTFNVIPSQVMEIKLLCSASASGAALLLKFMEIAKQEGIQLFVLEEADQRTPVPPSIYSPLVVFYQQYGFEYHPSFGSWLIIPEGHDVTRYMFALSTNSKTATRIEAPSRQSNPVKMDPRRKIQHDVDFNHQPGKRARLDLDIDPVKPNYFQDK